MAKKDKIKETNKKHFLKDYKAELKKVIWPTPKQLLNNTVAVITIVLLTAFIVFVLDVIFDLFNKYGITQMQSKIRTTFTENSTAESTNQINNSTVNEIENSVE